MSGQAVSGRGRRSQRIHRVRLSHLYARLIVLSRRVAQLEQKLDGLVTLLTSKQPSSQVIPLDHASGVLIPRSPVSLDSNASTGEQSSAANLSINLDRETTALETFNGSNSLAKLIPPVTAGSLSVTRRGPFQLEPDDQEAESLLLEFKTNLAGQFPFVVLPLESMPQSLYHERPLLWKAIMVASSHDNSHRQMTLGANLVEDLIMRLLFRAEKSLDLLQSLLVLIAWYIPSAV